VEWWLGPRCATLKSNCARRRDLQTCPTLYEFQHGEYAKRHIYASAYILELGKPAYFLHGISP
jgi:hypothetical protein